MLSSLWSRQMRKPVLCWDFSIPEPTVSPSQSWKQLRRFLFLLLYSLESCWIASVVAGIFHGSCHATSWINSKSFEHIAGYLLCHSLCHFKNKNYCICTHAIPWLNQHKFIIHERCDLHEVLGWKENVTSNSLVSLEWLNLGLVCLDVTAQTLRSLLLFFSSIWHTQLITGAGEPPLPHTLSH